MSSVSANPFRPTLSLSRSRRVRAYTTATCDPHPRRSLHGVRFNQPFGDTTDWDLSPNIATGKRGFSTISPTLRRDRRRTPSWAPKPPRSGSKPTPGRQCRSSRLLGARPDETKHCKLGHVLHGAAGSAYALCRSVSRFTYRPRAGHDGSPTV